ncbi:uncharacterized protein N7459_001633 [Penicillium hispanicum]|uniref:uncharacterized protein n=1 Tax=Penicillium hispanicum TaxID=1080232 RepID=UPI0025405CE4|nr:uncharacterized protein N7459_001633 [Penicillium hispanicum]KAJ5595425.1 hypothetical protein N7459_001633 [Penicillium hispanicum]
MIASFTLQLVAVAVVLAIIRRLVTSWRHARKARTLGCGDLPLYPYKDPIGISTLRQTLYEQRLRTLEELQGRYVTTFMIYNMGREIIVTADPKNIQAMLATQFKDFELGSVRRSSMHPMLGTGIFTADGEEWSRSRGLLRPQFTREQISQLELEEGHMQNMMRLLPVASDGWSAPTDLQSRFSRLTIDSATEFLFGESVESQLAANGPDNKDNFAYYFDYSLWVCSLRGRLEKLAFLANTKAARHSDRQCRQFVDRFVHKALRKDPNPKTDEKTPYVFLDALTATTRDPIRLRSEVLNILLAGRDTTASLLSWTTLMLARHPQVFQKLRETILETFGTYSHPRNLTFATLKSCQYLQYCFNETLRLYPVVPFNRRNATCDTTLPHGGGPDGLSPIYLRKGQPVIYSVHLMHRRKDLWGPDAEEFKPDRWGSRKAGWEYLPFNGGPRICIGQQFALTEAGYVLARLLQRFDKIEDVYPDRKIRYGLSLTCCPGDPVTVRMHEAADA